MRTPKEYMNNIKAGIITDKMLAESLFSVNKRAKNCRDKEREYRNSYDIYNNCEKYREQKEVYYRAKDKMLSLLSPVCIHKESFMKRTRIYDYEPYYWEELEQNKVVHTGEYFDKDLKEYVEFADVLLEDARYYLFYKIGSYSFHSPIFEYELDNYSELNTIKIDSLITNGKAISELLSTQFINKMLDVIQSGKFELRMA